MPFRVLLGRLKLEAGAGARRLLKELGSGGIGTAGCRNLRAGETLSSIEARDVRRAHTLLKTQRPDTSDDRREGVISIPISPK